MDQNQFIDKLREVYAQLVVDFFQMIPKLLGALGVIVVGYLVAHAMRILVRRLLENIDRLLPSQLSRRATRQLADGRSFADLTSRVVFWFVIFVSLTVTTEVVEFNIVGIWLSGLTAYLPKLLAAVLIGFVGVAAGKVAREMVSRFTRTVGVGRSQMLGRTAQVIILIATGIIVAGQVGIEVTFLTQLAVIVVASVLGGAALAFGIGSRTLVSNILASHYLRQKYRTGQTIRISGNEGRIVEITATAVILQGKAGQVSVPAKEFEEAASVLISRRR